MLHFSGSGGQRKIVELKAKGEFVFETSSTLALTDYAALVLTLLGSANNQPGAKFVDLSLLLPLHADTRARVTQMNVIYSRCVHSENITTRVESIRESPAPI